jgi:CheY-like chemotaxis protein
MRAWIAVTLGAVASLTLASFDAHACGESLFRVGRGVAFRNQGAPIPGNILVVSHRPESKQLAERLAEAGHRVRFVETPEQVAQEIRTGNYDVVLANLDDRELIERESAGIAKPPAYVPVTTNDTQKERAAEAYPRYVSVDGSFNDLLRTLYRTLKATA